MKDIAAMSRLMDKATASANAAFGANLPLDQPGDREAAMRGRIAALPDGGIDGPDGGIDGPDGGRKAWDMSAFDFLKGSPADTVNPSLWRMVQLNGTSGLIDVGVGVWRAPCVD